MKNEQSADVSVVSAIAAVRQAWLDAVRDGDVERLGALVADDVVVVHGNGRCLFSKAELKTDFRKAFEAFSVEQSVSSPEVVVRGRWAFAIADVESRLTNRSGESMLVHSTTVVALSQDSNGLWKVGRVLGLVHAPPACQ